MVACSESVAEQATSDPANTALLENDETALTPETGKIIESPDVKDSIDQLNNDPLPDPPAKVAWEGMYFFDNPGGKAGKNLLGNELELEIDKDGTGKLGIFSKSMATPHAKLKVTTKAKGNLCRVIHAEYIKGTGWEDLEVGSVLFTLKSEGGELLTRWGAWQPLYGELAEEGAYFQKQ